MSAFKSALSGLEAMRIYTGSNAKQVSLSVFLYHYVYACLVPGALIATATRYLIGGLDRRGHRNRPVVATAASNGNQVMHV